MSTKISIPWKAQYAVRDKDLVQRLCDTLQDILGDDIISEKEQQELLPSFSPILLQKNKKDWCTNSNEAKVAALLEKGVLDAACQCLRLYHGSQDDYLGIERQPAPLKSLHRVDFSLTGENDQPLVLCEAKSMAVMQLVGDDLPHEGSELMWDPNDHNVMHNVLNKMALYLGIWQVEWLFLTSHNQWIVCRLVHDDQHPFLAYSPIISIEDSTEPFRALLGAILSVIKKVPVKPGNFDPNLRFNLVSRPKKEAAPHGFSHKISKSELMVTAASPDSPKSSQEWIHLHALSECRLTLPQFAWKSKPHLRLTDTIGSGSTGEVWQCHFSNNSESSPSYAAKIVEVLHPSDEDRRQRLRNELDTYQLLEDAYTSGKLRSRITPQCYGAFGNDYAELILLDLCGDTLNDWDELSASERDQVYKLVQDLHTIGITHGDLVPRNVVRVHGGGFRLIDFSHSQKYNCKESKMSGTLPNGPRVPQGSLNLQELHELRRSFKL